MDCNIESPKKKKKLKRDIDSNILDRFWDLVDVSDNKRLKAAEQLLTALSIKQPPVNHCVNWGHKNDSYNSGRCN